MVRGQNMISNGHFHKDWKRGIKTWFNQPFKKQRKRRTRTARNSKLAPRPSGLLRPGVRCPGLRYNLKMRIGRGFTLAEVKKAGLCAGFAKSIGIAVDPRRRSKSMETLQLNAQRLKEYKARLVLFPTKPKRKLKKGEATEKERALAAQIKGPLMPLKKYNSVMSSRKAIIPTDDMKKGSVFAALRKARADVRLVGKRAKKSKDMADTLIMGSEKKN